MPKFKQLEVQGFKSFAEPQLFLYPTGVTAIVGPNGSGKSNVADAVRWVLGEQRMTAIRGHSGEDMIFAGSKKRSRAGMARAAITLDNSDNWLPVDFAEVTIERRTYRDGKTDYLLNGAKVRLMDLRDLLDRAGLGRDAYLIIGQGLVDQVLSLRPKERLALFEQAAGIAPYRNRREDAVHRLDETQRNLVRVYDIVSEIEPRLRRLKRQAERAEQHIALTQELLETLRVWYGYRWSHAVADLEQARQRVVYREKQALQRLEASNKVTDSILALRREIAEVRASLADLHRESSAQHTEAERRQRELAVAREHQRQLDVRQEESQGHLTPLRAALDAEQQDVATLQQDLAALETQAQSAQAQLVEADVAHREVDRQRQALLARQSAAQTQALAGRRQLADRQSRLEQTGGRLTQLAQRVQQLEAGLTTSAETRRARQAAVDQARQALDALEAEAQAAEVAAEHLNATQDAARAETERLRREVGRQQAELQQIAGRLAALERLHAEGAGLYAGVRAVLQASEQEELPGLCGAFATLIETPPHLDRAIETALGAQMQDVVAERWADAQAAIEWLKQRRAGRATFLPLDTLRPPPLLEIPRVPGIVGVAAELVEYAPRYHPAVLLHLGRTAIAESLDAARQLYRQLQGGFRIVTLDGEIVRSGGAVTGGEIPGGGKGQGEGLLARERDRRELPAQVAAAEADARALRDALRESEARGQSLHQEAQALTERRRRVARQRSEAEQALDREVRALDKLIQESDWQKNLAAEAGKERERLEAERVRLGEECAAAEAALAEAEAQLGALAGELDALADAESARVLAERRTQAALLEQERENRRGLLEARQREVQRLQRQIAAQEQRIGTLTQEGQGLAAQVALLQARYDEVRASADALSVQIPPLEARLAEMESALAGHEEQERETRRVLHEAEQRLSQAEVEGNRREDQLRALRREIEEALGIVVGDLPESLSAQQPLPLEAIASPLPVVQELPEGLERQIRDLRTQIHRLEPVNMAAKEEYDEVEERRRFLREQMDDLEKASAQLKQVIAELDGMMETTFRTTFKGIATEFVRIFEILFNGGTAKLELMTDEEGQAGVDITARPPGKRTSGLGMLSGGERTLTAVALLFAVMRVSPTPFCMLDEVDAMLDEANVGRFRAMLQDLARETQFIVITHNRGTVEVAETIYGVSMGEDGVSQVLSLALEDLPTSEVI